MAIKTSWTAGEVLTAADLTDTFADKVDLTPSATQTITSGTATVKPLVIKAAASQTANLLEFQNSAGTAVRAVLPDGTITGQNLLYNGAMQVAQRGTSTANITTDGYHTADRWLTTISSLGTWTQSIENDAPTGSGLRKSLKMLCTTADAAPAAADYLFVRQLLEGQDLQRIAKGTASAQQITLSFWVKANVTGTYIVSLQDVDNSRWVSASYSVSASATWEKKTITIPADTTGAFDNDSSASLSVYWALAVGSDRSSGTLSTSWAALTLANTFVGQTNLAAATNNYWQLTGVQLEVGPVASSFEFKSYGQELRECQRYYQLVNFASGTGNSTTQIAASVPFFQQMRGAPTISSTGVLEFSDGTADKVQSSVSVTDLGTTNRNALILLGNFSTLTANRPYIGTRNNVNTNSITLNAEL